MKCLICNDDFECFRSLSRHIIKSEHVTIKDYYDKYYKKPEDGNCLFCGKPTVFNSISRGYGLYCSRICCNSSPIRSKKISSILLKKDTQNKRISTCLKKYGVDNVFKNDSVKLKYKKTCLDRYGVDNVLNMKNVIDKRKQTNLSKYGYASVFECPSIQDKIKQTNLRKYNSEYSSQNPSTRSKYRDTCLLKFGVDNYSKTFEARLLFRENFLRDLSVQKNNGLPIKGRIGHFELPCLNDLQNVCKFKFQRIQIIGYLPDCYISELNLIIEFNEDFHNQSWCIKKDTIKYSDLYQHLNCDILIIPKRKWLEDKEQIIKDFIILQFLILLERNFS